MSSLTLRRYSGCLILFVLVVFKRVVCSPVEHNNNERGLRNSYRSSDRWFHSNKDNVGDFPENLYPDYMDLVKELPAQKSIEYEDFRNNEEEDQDIHFDDEFSKTDEKYRRFTSNPGKHNNEYHHGHHHDFKHHSSFHHDYDFHHPYGFQHGHNPECHFPHGGGPGRLPYPPRSPPRPGPPPRDLPPPSPPFTNVQSTTNSPAIPAIDPRQSTIASFASTQFPRIDLRWNENSADKKGFRNRNEDAIVFPE